MQCLRCTRRIALTSASLLPKRPTSLLQSSIRDSIAASPSQSTRTFASFSNITSTFQTTKRPTLASTPASNLSLATTLDNPTLPSSSVSPPGGLLQSRGPKRDTFDPSHRVRKRRHGFLARVRTRNGRNLLKRRRLKRRTTLGH